MVDEIYNYLSNVEKMGKKEFDFLASKYGEKTVNLVIDKMIEDDCDNVSKFDYYVSKLESDFYE